MMWIVILLVVVIVIIALCVKIVPQATCFVVEYSIQNNRVQIMTTTERLHKNYK